MSNGGGQLSELFLSIDDFWGRAPDLADALMGLDSRITPLATQGFYNPDDDRALIALVLDPRKTGRDMVSQLAQMLLSLRVDCFELSALSAPERDHFHTVELPRYNVQIKAADSAATAVNELYRVAGGTEGNGDWAQGTPAEAKRPSVGQYSQIRRNRPAASIRPPRDPERAATDTSAFLIKQKSDIAADLVGPTSWDTNESSFDRSATRKQIADGSGETAESPVLRQRRPTVGLGLRLRVRFLRGEKWLAGRVRYVSNREVKIATGAPLRLGDSAVVGLSFEREEVFVSGTVSTVEPIDSEPVSSPGFTVAFGRLSTRKADQLIGLLRRARDAGVSLTPPPVRGAPRFPVSWPVVVRTNRGAQRAVALDISWSGVYISVEGDVGTDVLFAIPLDNAGDSIRCRGKIVRVVNAEQAEAYQTNPGCGVIITHFGAGDAQRYRAFLARVKVRCQRRVVVAAAPLRAQGLTRALAAAGYAVTSSTDPNALAELADREPRPPDIAVIDESLAGAMEGEMLRALFRRRNVPCLATAEEATDHTRQQVDRMLAVEIP